MDESGNYPGERPRILGPEQSLKYVQNQLEKIENRRSSGCEKIKQRKEEIFEKAQSNWADLDRILSRRDAVPKLVSAAGISVCILGVYQFAKAVFGLARRVRRRRKQGFDEEMGEIETRTSSISTGLDDPGEWSGNETKTGKRRLHERDWNIRQLPDL